MIQKLLEQVLKEWSDNTSNSTLNNHVDDRIPTRDKIFRDYLRFLLVRRNNPCIPTGFAKLDEMLFGGLQEGLYIIGAMSSLGKTTFCLQIADQIARAGYDVLFFSLEMSTADMLSRSFSRLTFLREQAAGRDSTNAKKAADLKRGECFSTGEDILLEVVQDAMEDYYENYSHMHIVSREQATKVSDLINTIQTYIEQTDKTPVVFIDYLQIIGADEPKSTDKQNMDTVITELKHMSVAFHTPIIVISSLNRNSYTSSVTHSSFKESGSVEYSADVLIGMQYAGMEPRAGEMEKARELRVSQMMQNMNALAAKGNAQEIQVVILKNRDGSKGSYVMNFYPAYNCFQEQRKTAESTANSISETDWRNRPRRKRKSSPENLSTSEPTAEHNTPM